MTELDLVNGWVEAELADEFPQLSLVHARVEVHPGKSPPELKQRLRMLADRYTGGKVVHMRQDPVPWAYRVFSRQVGIDPDTDRTPVEGVALRRLKQGGLQSENVVDDALTIAIAETGVPLIALDAECVDGDLGLRLARAGETLGESRPLSARQSLLASELTALAPSSSTICTASPSTCCARSKVSPIATLAAYEHFGLDSILGNQNSPTLF